MDHYHYVLTYMDGTIYKKFKKNEAKKKKDKISRTLRVLNEQSLVLSFY